MDAKFNLDHVILPRNIKCTKIEAVEPSGLRSQYDGEITFSKTISYRNGTPWPITIVEQSGLAITIPRLENTNRSTNAFVVEVRYSYTTGVSLDVYRMLDRVDDTSTEEMKSIRQHYDAGRMRVQNYGNCFIIAYEISQDRLNVNSGPVFIPEVNLTAYVRSPNDIREVVHPHSVMGKWLSVEINEIGAFNYGIEIVDPDNIFGEHYVNIANNIFKVPIKRGRFKTPGVYVHLSQDAQVLDFYSDTNSMLSEYYRFDEAPVKLQLFRTAKEAVELGDIAKERKLQLENHILENKFKASDRELEAKQHAHKRDLESLELSSKLNELEMRFKKESIEAKQELQKLEQQLQREQNDNARMKAERDKALSDINYKQSVAQADRRDMSEMIKWIPMIALAFGAIVKTLI